jgi:hypothetical protein
MDGTVIDSLDCYNATQIWQQQKTYTVASGNHIVTVAVSGTKNASSANTFILFDAFIVAGTVSSSTLSRRIQTTLDLVGQDPTAATALQGWVGTTYSFAQDALTASTRALYMDLKLATLVYARWLVVWNPRNSSSGVRLIHADSGPTNIVEIAKFDTNPATTPVPSAVDVTTTLATLVSANVMKFLGHQSKGNGSQGAIIFSSSIEMVWDVT